MEKIELMFCFGIDSKERNFRTCCEVLKHVPYLRIIERSDTADSRHDVLSEYACVTTHLTFGF